MQPSTILVTGATGLIGRHLVAALTRSGVQVIALSRDPGRAASAIGGPKVRLVGRLSELPAHADIDAVVHLAGARVLDRRWTRARWRLLVESRTTITDEILSLCSRLAQPPRVLVSASAVSYYGHADAAVRTEDDLPLRPDDASALCARIEAAALRARDLGMRVVPLRLGIVLARDDGALPPLALAARFGLGATLGSGRQPVSWIHIEDAVRLVQHVLATPSLVGPVNAVAPQTPVQAEFARALAARSGTKVRLRVPAWVLRGMLGERATLLLDGQFVEPRAALESGFAFQHPTLESALRSLLAE